MSIVVRIDGQPVAKFPDGTPDSVIDEIMARDFGENLAHRGGATGGWDAPDERPDALDERPDALARLGLAANPGPDFAALAEAVVTPSAWPAIASKLLDTREQGAEAADAWRRQLAEGGHAKEAIYKSAAAIPFVGPIAEGLEREIVEPFEQDDYATGTGRIIKNLIPLGVLKAGGRLARGAGAIGKVIEAGAVEKYSQAMAGTPGPLTETLASKMRAFQKLPIPDPHGGPQAALKAQRAALKAEIEHLQMVERTAPEMMDQGIIAKPEMGNTALANAAAAEAKLAGMPQAVPIRGPKGMQANPATPGIRAARTAIKDEITFNRNVAQITERLSGGPDINNILYEGAKTSLGLEIGSAVAGSVVPGSTAALGFAKGHNYVRVMQQIPKTAAWKTALPLYKREFGQALQTGNFERAAEIGAGIMSGVLLPDDFGHREAVTALGEELDAVPNVNMKRQVVGRKSAVYGGPDGQQFPIPQNVMSQFAGAQRLTAFDSPISAYLTAMEKQGKIKKGGRLEFR